jgi:cell division transport system ATP-binding protein
VIDFDEVSLRYATGPEVLRDITFKFDPGSFHFVFGASGAGKSSILKLMYLGRTASAGAISLFGRDVRSLTRDERAQLRRKIGVVFQDFRLLEHLTALENVLLCQEIAGRDAIRAREEAAELLAWVGLGNHLDAFPQTLSGGQQQRVAIARAVVGRPRLLIADEPTGNVDDTLAIRLLYLFEELNRLGTTVVIATHNKSLVSRFRHPILRLAKGSAKLEGPLSPAPREKEVAR